MDPAENVYIQMAETSQSELSASRHCSGSLRVGLQGVTALG